MPDAGVPVAAGPLDRLNNPRRGKARQKFLEQHPQFQPGQISAQAVVHTLTKAQMWIGFSGDVELIGAIEHTGIAVGRAFPDLYLLPRFDRLSAEGEVTGGGSALGWRR